MRLSRDLLFSVVVALLAGTAAWVSVERLTQTADVVVATRDIDPMATLEAQHLKVVRLPVAAVHSTAYRQTKNVLGKRATGPIAGGQQVLQAHVSDSGGLRAWASPAGVVMFIPMPLGRWVGGSIKPGDTVDLIFCASEQRTGNSAAKLVVSRVPVISQSGGNQRKWDGMSSETTGLTVLLSVEDAEKVAYCLENGTLYACLNPHGNWHTGLGANLQSVMTTGVSEPPRPVLKPR